LAVGSWQLAVGREQQVGQFEIRNSKWKSPPARSVSARLAGVPSGPVPGTVEIESQYEVGTSAAVPGTDMENQELKIR